MARPRLPTAGSSLRDKCDGQADIMGAVDEEALQKHTNKIVDKSVSRGVEGEEKGRGGIHVIGLGVAPSRADDVAAVS